MSKKIVVLLLMLFALTGITIAEEIAMPTDEEIMSVLDKYDFTKEQKEYLLKETRKTIQEKLSTGDIQKAMSELKNTEVNSTEYNGSLMNLNKK
jgi:ATP-dependent Lon protease